jgi:hypothetical protein
MDLSDKQVAFFQKAHGAAMVTLRADGTPPRGAVGVALVDGCDISAIYIKPVSK